MVYTQWQQRQLRLVQCFFYWWILAKFQPHKYDFNLHNGFFMGKVNGPNSLDFEIENLEIARVLRWLPKGSQEYRRILCFFLPSYLLCSQIWLNYFLDDYHFGYIPISLKETLERWLKFSAVPAQNLLWKIIIAAGCIAGNFSCCCVLSHSSRFQVFNKSHAIPGWVLSLCSNARGEMFCSYKLPTWKTIQSKG
jgi:hypothetical protein